MKNAHELKQAALKPQDVVVVAKIAIAEARSALTFAGLGAELFMSASEVHAAVQRATTSTLLGREYGELTVNRTALTELLVHGIRYIFPAVFGPIARGIPTSIFTPPLAQFFDHGRESLPVIWPHSAGEIRGMALCPLYPSVPLASLRDPRLHQMLALVDALRAGAARERELAEAHLPKYLL
ncbi:hypothetical protein [Roseateles sp. LYH14W]|uniref:Uncharacterized protein n=1 Tax=Pelomonas parva TaxID=3299032 RepID=A0ABW7F963_9BURK